MFVYRRTILFPICILQHESQIDLRFCLCEFYADQWLMNGCNHENVKCMMYICTYFQNINTKKTDNAVSIHLRLDLKCKI